jgi:hypothetical protein
MGTSTINWKPKEVVAAGLGKSATPTAPGDSVSSL